MSAIERPSARPGLRRALMAAAAALVLAALPTAAFAHGRSHHYRDLVRPHHHHGRFVVPHRIVHAHAWRPYAAGSFYYAPHRHVHAIYRFPVYVGLRLVYAPHAYCDGALFAYGPRAYVSYATPSFGGFVNF